MAMTVTDLILELQELEKAGHGDKVVKYVGSCGHGDELDAEIDGAEPGDSAFPDEVWMS